MYDTNSSRFRNVDSSKADMERLASKAMWTWHRQIASYELDENATYVNPNMAEFANVRNAIAFFLGQCQILNAICFGLIFFSKS